MHDPRHVDAVVVGSGFGGSVAAYRLADAGREVVLLERGKAYPPGSFARTPAEMSTAFWDPSEGLHGLFDVWSFAGLDGVVSAGLGGGSLIYANVLLRKDEKWFVHDAPVGDGYESWPISRADLEPHYAAVESMIGVQQFPMGRPGYEASGKTSAMREAAGRLSLDWQLPPLAVSFAPRGGNIPEPGALIPPPAYGNIHGRMRQTCRLSGECDIGCNYGSKNTLDHTYLSAAAAKGAEIRTGCEVRGFAPLPGGGFGVRFVEHLPENEGLRTATQSLPETTVRCSTLVLGAGTFGTTYLLLRNRSAFPGVSQRLGHRFCGNGDLLGFMLGAKDANGGPRSLGSTRAPVITSAIRVPDEVDGGSGRGFYLEDAGYPGFVDYLIETADLPLVTRRALVFALHRAAAGLGRIRHTPLGGQLHQLIGDGHGSASATALLGMGRDVPDGIMTVADDMLEIAWNMRTSEAYFGRVRDTMAAIARELGASFVSNPLSHLNRVITVHPLGGCSMGGAPDTGVIDSYGELFGFPGLFVVDGSAMPGPVGANPSLTIAAFADRVVEQILSRPAPTRPPATVSATLPPPTPILSGSDPSGSTSASVEFTEDMKGFFALSEADEQRGYDVGKHADNRLMFHLTIRVADVQAFVRDRDHTGTAHGWVEAPALGGRLPVETGEFNLFVTETATSRRMLYRLYFSDAATNPLTLSGFKEVRDDPGLDLWPDTSTLYTKLFAGHVTSDQESAENIVGAGILHIHPFDFARQLTTFRGHGPTAAAGLGGLTSFGRLFLGELWDVYGVGAPPSAPSDERPSSP